MATPLRLVASLLAALLATTSARAQPAVAPPPHPPLAEVVAEYKRLGLPFPPPDAELVQIDWDWYLGRSGEEATGQHCLGYRVPPVKPGERVRYSTVGVLGVGFRDLGYVEPATAVETEPTPDALRGLLDFSPEYLLTFAVQCEERGWHELAVALYARARERFVAEEPDRTIIEEVRFIAWNYWEQSLVAPGGDRAEVLRRLKALAVEDESFRTPYTDWLLRAIELTRAPSKSKPGSIEALVDALTEYRQEDFGIGSVASDPASYWKLAELGFDAVPALIEHLGDDRLTRAVCVNIDLRSAHRLTVGHLCSRLLYDLSARTIGAAYSPALGDRLDPAEVEKWFERAKKVGEEKWLLDHAVPSDEALAVVPDGRPETLVVRVIGAKYPARLPIIYRAMLKKRLEWFWINDFVNEVVASKLPLKEKVALLEEGAAHEDFEHSARALQGLAKLDPTALRKHLLAALKRVKARAGKVEVEGESVRKLRQLVESVDDRASWDALLAAAKAVGVESRMNFLREIGPDRPPDERDPKRLERIRFLVQFLDDRDAEADDDGTRTEIRDYAAARLAGLFGFIVQRELLEELYWRPVYDATLGPFSRLILREAVRQAAARELVTGK
jgi:hypothetical protein